MKIRSVSILIVFLLGFLFLTTCRHEENVELLKSHLNTAIIESNALEAARLLDRLLKFGVDPPMLPIDEAADLILQSNTTTGDELVQMYGPLEGLQNGTWREYSIRGAYFCGLMETGQRKKALGLWQKSEIRINTILESPEWFLNSELPREEWALRNVVRTSIPSFITGFVSSKDPEDRLQGVELAKKFHRFHEESLKKITGSIQLANPIAQAQITRLIMFESLLAYSLVESGLAMDPAVNPYLMDEPETTIRLELVQDSGFRECGLWMADGNRNRIIIGDYDGDGYSDVLIPEQGLWRNLEGSGRFKRVDQALGVDIKGTLAALADVNNDGLVDVIVAGQGKYGVSLQTEGRIFRPLIKPANRVPENPTAIGLFDGDADGLIDVYLASRENDEVGRSEVLRNKGDGTFEDVAKAWGFSGDDVKPIADGISPGDYDDDGRTDIFVANATYPNDRNTLWRNVSEGKKAAFVQCAAAPWFGTDKRPEIPEGPDRGVEGWRTEYQGTIFWGHSCGAAWGDLDGNSTLDLICASLSHPRLMLSNNPPFIMDLSRVYLNTGHGFEDHTLDSGLVFREFNYDPLLADFNNDGHLDLSIVNRDRTWVNQLYEGNGDGSFREVTYRTGAFACNSVGQAAADFDNDGDLDWFVFDGNKGLLLYENKLIEKQKTPPSANWIELKLHGGKHANGMAYGARITVIANGRSQVREIYGMRGFSNCDDQVVHVGLGGFEGRVNVEVRWIGDRIQEFNGLDTNKRHELFESEEKDVR